MRRKNVVVNWLRLSLLLALALFSFGDSIQVAPDSKTSNITEPLQKKEESSSVVNNDTTVGDSELSASERSRRLIPYMAFYLPPDFPINQQYAITGLKGASPINGKNSKPQSFQSTLTQQSNGLVPVPQSYMNLRAPPSGDHNNNGDLMFAPAPQKQYLQNTGDTYHQMAYVGGGPSPTATTSSKQQHSQPAPPPLSQSLMNPKGSDVPLLHLLPPGPNVTPNIKHRHKTVQHFPPTKPPTLQQLPYEHLQQQMQEPQRPKKNQNRHQSLQKHQYRQQQIFVTQQEQQHQQQQQQQQLAPALSFNQQTRPKQSKVNLTPFTPSNTLPGHFIPIVYTPVSGNGNDNNNNNNNHNNNNNNNNNNALNYGYDNPTIVLVDDLSPPLQSVNVQQQQQQGQIQQQYRPSTQQNPQVNNEYTLVAPVELAQRQQQQLPHYHHNQQQYQQQQQTDLSTGSAASVPVIPHSTTSTPPAEYIDYIVDDPKQSLDDEQQYDPSITPQGFPPNNINQDYYEVTNRPNYKQQPTLRLKPLPSAGKSNNNYVTKRPTLPQAQPAPPPLPPSQSPQSIAMPVVLDKPKYIYADSNFGEKMSAPANKLRPSHKYSGGIGSRLAPQPAPRIQQAASPALSQQLEQKPPDNSPQYYNPLVPVAAKTTTISDTNQLPDIRTSSLAEILHKLQASNHLPKTLTPENIDNSIKTLVTILENLKQTQTIVANPPQHHDRPSASPDYDYSTGSEEVNGGGGVAPDLASILSPIGPNKHPGPSTGRAGIDYPNYADIPQTNFNCGEQRYKGFFGDPETNCQVWHYCDLNGGKASFLCPNGTIFSQIALTCDWWFNVKCSTTAQLYVLNERLYKYILPFTPKFPEDYSGPLVDKYLAMKFQEMEEKMRIEKEKKEKAADDATVAPTADIQTDSEIVAVNNGGVDVENDNIVAVTAIEDTEVTTIPDTRTVNGAVGHNKLGGINAHVSEQSSERNLLIDDEADDISKRGGIDAFESSTIPTAAAVAASASASASEANQDGMLLLTLKPIVVSSTQIPIYDDAVDDDEANEANKNVNTNEQNISAYNLRNVDDATSSRTATATATATTEIAQQPPQATTQSQTQLLQEENQEEEIQSSPKPVRQAITNIDVEKVEVIEIKADAANGQTGPKMYYGAESVKDV